VLSTLAVATLGIVGFASPANAQPTGDDTAGVCWLDTDTEAYECFESQQAWEEALAERGYVLVYLEEAPSAQEVEELGAARGGAGLLTIYVLSIMYEDASYGGDSIGVTTTNPAYCSGTSYSGNMPAGFNDAVSSFQSYLGCRTRLAQNTGQGGSLYGPFTSASSLGAFNDTASSYLVLD
jgi:hypothetical protein